MEENPDLIIKGSIKHGPRDITCGNCGRWEYLYSHKMCFVTQEAKEKGWKKTKTHGWICKKCRAIAEAEGRE